MDQEKVLQGVRPLQAQIIPIVLARLDPGGSVVEALVVVPFSVVLGLELEAATTPGLMEETIITTSLPAFSER